jgi:hypothetical protein
MITAELISYINDQKKKGKTKENIISELLSVGWAEDDIEDGFKTIDGADKYREPITEDDVLDPDKPITDLNSFYPQKESVIIEDKKNDNTETSVEETTTPQTGESLFFAKDKTVLADNPLPIEEEKKEPMVKAEGSLAKIGQIEEEKIKEKIKEEIKPVLPEESVLAKPEPEVKTEPVIAPEKNFIFPTTEKKETINIIKESENKETINLIKEGENKELANLIKKEEKNDESTAITGGRKPTPLGSYSLNIPGVQFFDINGKKIENELPKEDETGEIKTDNDTIKEESSSVDKINNPEIEISDFLKPTEPKNKTDDEIEIFRQMKNSLNQPKEDSTVVSPTATIADEPKPNMVPEISIPESGAPKILKEEEQIIPKVSRITIPLAKIPEINERVRAPISDTIKKETQKVWTPMTVPTKIVEDSVYLMSEDGAIEHRSVNRMDEVKRFQDSLSNKADEVYEKPGSEVNPKDIYADNVKEQPGVLQRQEMGPNFIPKKGVDSVGPAVPNSTSNYPKPEPTKNQNFDNISKVAMISSFHEDLARVNQNSAITPKAPLLKKKKKGTKTILIVLLILCLLGAGAWAYTNDMLNLNISLESLGISFIKKNPKELLLNYSNILSSLNSYKSETDIKIISPSLENISRGLISGEAVVSPEKDSININSIGTVSKNSGGLISDSFITIKGTVFEDYISTDVKDDGNNLYVTIPNLENIVKDFIIKPSIVKINQEELSSFYSLFNPKLENIARKVNLYKLLSKSIPSYINEKILLAYNGLVTNIEVVEKGEENIKGINTYRYSITTDRQAVKNLLTIVTDGVTQSLSEEEKRHIDEVLSSLEISLFDVWVGKGDNNIYQYNIVANVPLSKVLGFEDKSIGDNKISVSWKTTYYDFEVENYIQTPSDFVIFLDYFNEIKKEKIKKELNYFVELASGLKKEINNYGAKSNKEGSCMSPISGSLFSPTGHPKSVTNQISLISELLNEIMAETKNNGDCYSTSSDWAFAVPLSDNYLKQDEENNFSKYYCVDSTGNRLETDKKLSGTVCPVE